jgi:hypothetical protein
MQLLREEWIEANIIATLLPLQDQLEKCQQPASKKLSAGLIIHPNGQYHFITSPYKRFDATYLLEKSIISELLMKPI